MPNLSANTPSTDYDSSEPDVSDYLEEDEDEDGDYEIEALVGPTPMYITETADVATRVENNLLKLAYSAKNKALVSKIRLDRPELIRSAKAYNEPFLEALEVEAYKYYTKFKKTHPTVKEILYPIDDWLEGGAVGPSRRMFVGENDSDFDEVGTPPSFSDRGEEDSSEERSLKNKKAGGGEDYAAVEDRGGEAEEDDIAVGEEDEEDDIAVEGEEDEYAEWRVGYRAFKAAEGENDEDEDGGASGDWAQNEMHGNWLGDLKSCSGDSSPDTATPRQFDKDAQNPISIKAKSADAEDEDEYSDWLNELGLSSGDSSPDVATPRQSDKDAQSPLSSEDGSGEKHSVVRRTNSQRNRNIRGESNNTPYVSNQYNRYHESSSSESDMKKFRRAWTAARDRKIQGHSAYNLNA
jgi:hypothetical protein